MQLFPENIHLELLHPVTKEPTGLTLELEKKGVSDDTDFIYSLDRKIKIAAACVVGWKNTSEDWKQIFMKLGFTDDVYSAEKAVALLSMKTASWIRAQIDIALADSERFFKSASNA
jgi:hypothetical protein